MVELNKDCGDDCLKKGTQWSYMLLANGLLMIMLFCNLGCVCMGRIKPKWRMMSTYVGLILCLGHIVILVFTGMFLFRPQGQLCSLNLGKTSAATPKLKNLNDTWTYQKDGMLLQILWILQIIGASICCVLGGS